MDQKAGFFSDLKGDKNATMFCFRATMSTSSGIWLQEHPLDFFFPLFLAQLSIIFLTSRLVHVLLRPIGLPQVISHTIAGIILGPSLLSRNRFFQETFFPLRSWVHLELISQFSFVLFIFVIGVKTDLSLICRSGRKALCVSVVGTIFPYVTILTAAIAHPGIIEDATYGRIVTNLANRWAVTSNTVVSCLLAEFNLLTSKLGRLAMSASLIAEFQVVILTALFNSIYYGGSFLIILAYLFSFGGLIAFIWVLARPLTVWIVRRTPDGATLDDTCFIFVVLLALGSSVAGELLGETPMAGPLLLGLLLPSGPPLGTALVDRLDSIGSEVFLPVFLAVAGLRTNLYEFANVDDGRSGSGGHSKWSRTAYLIVLGVLGKFIGVIIPCIYCKMSFREAFILAVILNCHGVVEIFSFNSWEDYRKADAEIYAMNMIALVIVGGATGSLLKALYGPSARLAARKRRTVQGVGHLGELRLLACVHGDENVSPLLALIDVIYPSTISPLCVYLLHLCPLAGQSQATLFPYKKKKRRRASFNSLSTGSTSDRIVNSFHELERQHPPGRLAMLPFIGVSPYATMHDDICSLAQDKMVDLVLLPFHRRIDSGVLLPDSVRPDVRAVNTNVLLYAPCTVAILVDRGLAGGAVYIMGTAHRVVAFFIGGGDDREALALATRMVENSSIELTVVRFLLPKELEGGCRDGEGEEALDDDAIEQFLILHERNDRVVYKEEEVTEGAETVAAIRERSEDCSLIVVGRGHGRVSRMTSGLEMWSEFPELGVVGDMLASPDFGGKASVLVVQHPAMAAAGVAKPPSSQAGSVVCDKQVIQEEQHPCSDPESGNELKDRLINEGDRQGDKNCFNSS